jgi:hypothetical protein
MLHEQQARTIIGSTVGQSPSPKQKPGVAYCHNAMPTQYGMASIAYKTLVTGATFGQGEQFEDVRDAFGDLKTRIYLGFTNLGNVYVLVTGSNPSWVQLPVTSPALTPGTSPDDITIGNVNGISYIFYANSGGFTYNEVTQQLDPVVFTGLDISETVGVAGSAGYLVAFSSDAIAWGSTLVPTDFVPDQVTGAGGGAVADIAGAIKFCVPNSLGLIIYTEANAVAATFTGNTQFPFRFKEIEDSKGGISLDLIAYQANSGNQFVYSKAGIQAIKISKAETILPEATDFLAGRRFEDYNEVTKQYEITDISDTSTLLKKIKYIGSRYLVVSYGLTSFTHAIVLDTALGRVGKLKTDHVDVFEYVNQQSEVAKENFAFLKSDGQIDVVDFSVSNPSSSGVLILGKLQQTRNRFISLEGVEVENAQEGDTLDVHSQVSLDGKNFTVTEGFLATSDPNLKTYNFHAEGKNHSIGLIGKFNTTTVQVTYVQSSRR